MGISNTTETKKAENIQRPFVWSNPQKH